MAQKTKNNATQEIRRIGCGESIICRLVATARGLPPNVIPQRKPAPRGPGETCKAANNLMRQEDSLDMICCGEMLSLLAIDGLPLCLSGTHSVALV